MDSSLFLSSFFFLLLLLLSSASLITAAPEGALITQLPGFNGTFPSKHYAGYVTVDESHGRNLFYYFVVSEGNPAKDPVVLWLNGGPGCSSFDGFVYEHGPFNFESGGAPGSLPKLHLNPYSWSKVSNIIYLDSPAGVGLSYSNNQSDYITGDLKTATDSHTFLLKWFEQYPEFLENSFFISGESYAGVYVPTLASEVVKGIENGVKPTLNFKGYMVGNGVCDSEFDGDALVPFAHGMGLISDSLFQEVNAACHGSYWNPVNDSCKTKLGRVDWELNNLNIYDILEPCYHGTEIREVVSGKNRLPSSFRRLGETEKPLPVRKRMFGRSWPLRAPVRDGRVPTWPELGSSSVPCMIASSNPEIEEKNSRDCGKIIKTESVVQHDCYSLTSAPIAQLSDEVATAWLNNAAVRNAIHAQPENLLGPWELCSGNIDFHHDAGSMIKYHNNLTAGGYHALIYSGDHDMCVPFTGSEAWTRSLGYQIIDAWRPWYLDEQVAGYIQGYDHNLTFLTIKGAGHTVPEYKPREALAFYTRWLAGAKV